MKCLKVCEANKLDEILYFLINPTNIFISALGTLHNYTSRSGNWFCNTCIGKCKQQPKLSNILAMNGHDLSMKNQRLIEYTVVTSNQIPMDLDETLCSNYDKQLSEGSIYQLI